MEFVPFQAPQSDHHTLNTGLSTEGGVTAKGLVDGLNVYLGQLFAAVNGSVPKMIQSGKADLQALRQRGTGMVTSAEPDIVKLIAHLSDRITQLEQRFSPAPSTLRADIEQAKAMFNPSPDQTGALKAGTYDAKAAYMAEADALAQANPHRETAAEAVKRVQSGLAARLDAMKDRTKSADDLIAANGGTSGTSVAPPRSLADMLDGAK